MSLDKGVYKYQPKHFSREYKNWPLYNQEHLNIACIESEGSTVEELLDNAIIYIETWHGNEGPRYDAGNLSSIDLRLLTEEFSVFLGYT